MRCPLWLGAPCSLAQRNLARHSAALWLGGPLARRPSGSAALGLGCHLAQWCAALCAGCALARRPVVEGLVAVAVVVAVAVAGGGCGGSGDGVGVGVCLCMGMWTSRHAPCRRRRVDGLMLL